MKAAFFQKLATKKAVEAEKRSWAGTNIEPKQRPEPEVVKAEVRAPLNFAPIIPAEEISEELDHVPLNRRKRKASAAPESSSTRTSAVEAPVLPSPPEIQEPTIPQPTGQPNLRENVLQAGDSGVGLRLLKSILSPADEAQLRGSVADHQFLEGVNRAVSGLHMLVFSFEKVAATAHREGKRHKSAQALHHQLQGEMDKLRAIHSQELEGIRTTLDFTRAELELARENLRSSRREVEVANSRTEMSRAAEESSKMDLRVMTEDRDSLKSRVEELEVVARAKAQSEEEWRSAFLSSKEFKDAVSDKAFDFFETGFQKSRDQIEEAGLLSPEIQGILSLEKAVESLPAEEEESAGQAPENKAGDQVD